MKVVVCIKEVFDSDDVVIDEKTKNIDRNKTKMIINPYDLHAVEAAIQMKEEYGAETYVLSMGVPSCEESLRYCLAMGIDNAILITDKSLAGSDTVVTTLTLSEAIKKIVPDFSLIICGKHSIDSETSIVGPGIAERSGIPQLTYVEKIEEIKDSKITVIKEFADCDQRVEAKLPALMTVTDTVNKARYPDLRRAHFAMDFEVKVLALSDLNLSEEEVGVIGSPTVVGEMHIIERGDSNCKIITGDAPELARQLSDLIGGFN